MDGHQKLHHEAWLSRRRFVQAAGVSAAGLALASLPMPADAQDAGASTSAGDFIKTVKSARLFDLSHLWDENSPIASVNPSFSMFLNATHQSTITQFDGHLSFTSEIMQWSGQHGAPSIDAIGHIGRDGKLFGGVDAFAATSDTRGIGRSGVGRNSTSPTTRRTFSSIGACCWTSRGSSRET